MDQWAIRVLGTLRLARNADYDRILELANEPKTLRDMLGYTGLESDFRYRLQTLRDNLRLFTPGLMARIDAEVVRAGHQALVSSAQTPLHGRCDSFVVETPVPFPTDFKLLYDAIRQLIPCCGQWHDTYPSLGWRQHAFNLRQFKRHYRIVQTLKTRSRKQPGKRKSIRSAGITC